MRMKFDEIIKNIDEQKLKELSKDSDGSSPFLPLKVNAHRKLCDYKLPNKKNEEYKYTFLKRHFDELAKENGNSLLDSLISERNKTIPDFYDENTDYSIKKPINITIVDGVCFYPSEQVTGLSIKSYDKITDENKKLIGNVFPNEDSFYLLNNLLFTDGVFIDVEEGTKINNPIVVTYIHNGSKLAFPRVFVRVGKNSSLNIIERHHNLSTKKIIHCAVLEAIIEENAILNSYKLQSGLSSKCICIDTPIVVQKRNSTLNSHLFSTGGMIIRNNPCIDLHNDACETFLYGFYFCTGKSHIDNHSTINHNHPHCNSNQLYKGIMHDNSVGVFNGKIYVQPEAQKTNAFQSNKNIVLSDSASIYTKPQLEIYADDVKCSHGCTIGELEEKHLFYLRARGLSKEEARALLIKAYASEIITKFPSELQAYLDAQINNRLLKDTTTRY